MDFGCLMQHRSGKVEIKYLDANTYTARLPISKLEELQEKCDAGPPEILNRLLTSKWRVADVRQTVRLGLLGGGNDAATVAALVARYCDDGMLGANVPAAAEILTAAIFGVKDEPLGGEGDGVKKKRQAKTPTGDAGASPTSTEPAP